MEFILYFLIIGSGVMFCILKFDTHQHKRMHKLYKDTGDLEPMFLKRSVDQKLKTLNTRLYGVANPAPAETVEKRVVLNGSPRGLVARDLAVLLTDFDAGKVDMKTYHHKLTEMLSTVKEPKPLQSQYKIPAK